MKNHKTIIKALSIAVIAGVGLAGCAVVPAYGPPPGYGPQVYAPAVVVAPWIGFGYQGGGRGHRGSHGRW